MHCTLPGEPPSYHRQLSMFKIQQTHGRGLQANMKFARESAHMVSVVLINQERPVR